MVQVSASRVDPDTATQSGSPDHDDDLPTRRLTRGIAAYEFPRGGGDVVRANRGYTLYSRRTGDPVARFRPTGQDDQVQVLWWRRETWGNPGGFGPVIMPLDQALEFVAIEGCFWIHA
jgi:hypothetical protein